MTQNKLSQARTDKDYWQMTQVKFTLVLSDPAKNKPAS